MHCGRGSPWQTVSEQLFSWIPPSWMGPTRWYSMGLSTHMTPLGPQERALLCCFALFTAITHILQVSVSQVQLFACPHCHGWHPHMPHLDLYLFAFKSPQITTVLKKTNAMSPSFSGSLKVVNPGHGVLVDTQAPSVLWLCRVWPPLQNHHGSCSPRGR